MMGLTEDLIATLRRQAGFQSYYGGADRTTGALVALTFWDTQEHAQVDRAALGDILPRLQASGVQMEPTEVYEVVAQT